MLFVRGIYSLFVLEENSKENINGKGKVKTNESVVAEIINVVNTF